MRRPSLLLSLILAVGCEKKAPPPVAEPVDDGSGTTEPAPIDPSERDKLLATLKTKRDEPQRNAADALADLAASDPGVIDALVELLREKTNAGAGRIAPNKFNSTREAAAVALVRCGPKGEAALKDKGVAILREGLFDKDAAVREHTAYTLGVVGAPLKPLAASLQRLCMDPDANVRAAAFDALRTVGVADVPQLAALLTDKNVDLRRPAAELISTLPDVPGEAVPALTRALDDENDLIRFAASEGIATAAPKGASAGTAEKLAGVIEKVYPPTFDPKSLRPDDPQEVYWRALTKMGKVSVPPLAGLLVHKNPLVRFLALRALGDIGAAAKEAADGVKKLLTDPAAEVALEAAATLARAGIDDPEASSLVKAALTSTERGVAAAAVSAIGRMGAIGKLLVPLALEKLTSPLADARYAAVNFVGELELAAAAKAIPDLAKLTADPEPLIRRQVGVVLEKLGPAASPAAEALGKALPGEKDDLTRDQYVDALIAMGPGAKPAVGSLLPLLADTSAPVTQRVRVIAAAVVADPASAPVAAALTKALGDSDENVRAASATAIGKLNPLPPDALAALVKLVKPEGPKRADSKLTVQVAAVRAMAGAGPRAKAARGDLDALATNSKLAGLALWAKVAVAAIDGDATKAAGTVRAGLSDKLQETRTAAAEALALVGATAADVPALLKLLKEPAGAKQAAAVALGTIGAPAKEAVPRLAELLTDAASDVRIAAADALGGMGPAASPAATKLREALRDPLVAAHARKALDRIGIKAEEPKK